MKMVILCSSCKKEFLEYASNRRFSRHFCSRACYGNSLKNKIGSNAPSYKHGLSHTPLHVKWCSMIQRCYNKNHHKYPIYGGRGIYVCERWKIFENFFSDMNISYKAHVKKYGKKNTTLERVAVNGNYSLENCKWATLKEQSNNRNTCINVFHDGRELNLKQWAIVLGVKYTTIYQRYKRGDWP